mgnify:CR=1 FL=1
MLTGLAGDVFLVSFYWTIKNIVVFLQCQARLYKGKGSVYDIMGKRIKHSGMVSSIEEGCIRVRILQTSACAQCKVAGHCNAAESKEKTVDVYGEDPASFHVGQAVTVVASETVGMKAVTMAFSVPFLIVVAVLFLSMKVTGNEPLSALLSIVALIPYYMAIYLNRGKIRERLSFRIE